VLFAGSVGVDVSACEGALGFVVADECAGLAQAVWEHSGGVGGR
jgi:hypothetical protein